MKVQILAKKQLSHAILIKSLLSLLHRQPVRNTSREKVLVIPVNIPVRNRFRSITNHQVLIVGIMLPADAKQQPLVKTARFILSPEQQVKIRIPNLHGIIQVKKRLHNRRILPGINIPNLPGLIPGVIQHHQSRTVQEVIQVHQGHRGARLIQHPHVQTAAVPIQRPHDQVAVQAAGQAAVVQDLLLQGVVREAEDKYAQLIFY